MSSASQPRGELPRAAHPCLRAAGLAVALLLALGAAGLAWARGLEQRYLPALTAELSHSLLNQQDRARGMEAMERLKNQGAVLQKAALRDPELLPLYGSSELLKGVAVKASVFFRNYPTGFSVFPIGKPGATSLILAQKIAGTGPAGPGRKVAVSLSPSWFYSVIDPHAYGGNFSPQLARAALLNPHLSFSLRRDLARRMAAFPETLDAEPFLGFLARHLARGGWSDRLVCAAAWPLGRLLQGIDLVQDHCETARTLSVERRLWAEPPEHQTKPLNWTQLLALTARDGMPYHVKSTEHLYFHDDAAFRAALEHGGEWEDAELLLRVLHELHFRPLLLTMPINGDFLEKQGMRRETLQLYAARLHALADRYGDPVRAFEDHLEDVHFIVDPHDHLSAKGWMYYNRALDEFVHTP